MSAATDAAMIAAMSNSAYTLVGGALVGAALADPGEESTLSGLMVDGETAEFGSNGENGAALFTSHRLLVAERVGMISKRMAVKAVRRSSIFSYAIDPDKTVSLSLFGTFGTVVLVFDEGFDPMLLSRWLGETLAPAAIVS